MREDCPAEIGAIPRTLEGRETALQTGRGSADTHSRPAFLAGRAFLHRAVPRNLMKHHAKQSGFTMMELVVVISILAILAGALIPRVANRMASARDARRLADIHAVRDAIDQFYLDHGRWPTHEQNAAYGGWDVSQDKNFIPELVEKGYLADVPHDPVDDDTYHYRYYVFDKGAYGCKGETPFFVLGIKGFETTDAAEKNQGFFKCAERNWGDEFAYVTGGGASYR